MSIASEIIRLQTAKANIKTSIENKGVTVPSNATLSSYSTYIDQISTGGSGGGGQTNNAVFTTISASDVTGATGVFNAALSAFIKPFITSAIIPDGYTSTYGQLFDGCTNLTTATIPDSMTTIGADIFNGCTSLTSVTIGTGLTELSADFCKDCTSLTSIGTTGSGADIEIPNNIITFGQSAFNGCTGLTTVTIPSSVTGIGHRAFYNCTGLTTVTIPSSVTSIGDSAFYNCSSLTSVTIPSSVTSIGDSAFKSCSTLASVTVLATTPPTLQNQYSALFDYNASGRKIYVPSASVEAYKAATGWSYYAADIEAIPT